MASPSPGAASPTGGSPAGPSVLRVLWLIKGLGPGGAEMLLVNHARVRDRQRFEYRAAYLVPWKDHLVGALRAEGVEVTCLDGPREWDLRWAVRLRRLLHVDPVDILHVHSPYVASVARLLLRTMPGADRPTLIYTEHNRWPRHGRMTRWANRLTMRFDDVDLVVSEDVRDSMPPALAVGVKVVVHGIDVAGARAHATERDDMRRELNASPDVVVIGTVANFRREKAYDDLLTAASLVPRDSPVLFVSVGQGPLEAEMRDRAAVLGLGSRFVFLGYRDDPLRVMSAFDIFTLASIHEGLPVSLMEALALGRPVVATTAGGIPQAVTDGVEGRLVSPGRPDKLAAAYLELLHHPERRGAMGTAAASRAEAFDVTRATSRLEAIYRSACEPGG